MLVILFRHFGFIAPKTLNYLAFQSFDFERTWWRLIQTRVVRTKFDIYVFINWIRLWVCLFSAFQFPSLTPMHIAIFDNMSINLKKIQLCLISKPIHLTLTTCDGDLVSPTIQIFHHMGILLFTDFEIHYSEKYT